MRLPAAGARSISFSAEKETVLHSKEKWGPVFGRLVVENGGQRLLYDCGDPFRPLRPALVEQRQAGVLTTRRLRVPLSRQSAAWRAEFTTPGILPLRRKGGT